MTTIARETVIQQFAVRFLLANVEEEDVREMLDEALTAAGHVPSIDGELLTMAEEGN